MSQKKQKVTVQLSGVLRCCIQNIGISGDVFIENDMYICKDCQRRFILIDNQWEPLDTYKGTKK